MAREELMDLDWSFQDISFDIFVVTSGQCPGDVSWNESSVGEGPLQRSLRAPHRYLDEESLKVKKKHRTVQELILRRDEDLVGVATAGDQVLLAGRALPMMGDFTESAVAAAASQGLVTWTLSYYDVINGVIFSRRGSTADRHVSILGDAASFNASGDQLEFEKPIWAGEMPLFDDEADAVPDNDQPGLEERLAKAGLAQWLPGTSGSRRLLQTSLTVFEIVR